MLDNPAPIRHFTADKIRSTPSPDWLLRSLVVIPPDSHHRVVSYRSLAVSFPHPMHPQMTHTPVSSPHVANLSKVTPSLATAMFLAFSASANAQTVVNGGFEFNEVSPEAPGGAYSQGDDIVGWQIHKGGDLFVVSSPSKEHGLGAPVSSSGLDSKEPLKEIDSKYSNQYASNLLSSVGSGLYGSILSQKVDGFKPKTEYSLNYFIADYLGGDKYAALLGVSIYGSTGELLSSFDDKIESEVGFADESFTGNEQTLWEERSLKFTPDGEAITLRFDFGPKAYEEYPGLDLKDGSKEGGKYFYTAGLDSISISPVTVPEPTSTLLLGALGTLSLLRRRRSN